MPVVILTPSGALLAHHAPSLFGGAPRFVAHPRPLRARVFGNGVRFSDEGDIDCLRLLCRPSDSVANVRHGSEGALAEIVARHFVPKAAQPLRPLPARPSNQAFMERLAAHLVTTEGTRHQLSHVIAPRTFVDDSRAAPDSCAHQLLTGLGPDLEPIDLALAVARTPHDALVVVGPYMTTLVRDGVVLGEAPPSQAAAFATGLAPFILRQLATFAQVPKVLDEAFDDFSLRIALGRVEERVFAALTAKTPCVLGGNRAPLFVAPDPSHFALPTSLQRALDEAKARGVPLSPTLTSLLDARTREQQRVLKDAERLAAFEAELHLPPLDDAKEWMRKSALAELLGTHSDQGHPLAVLGQAPALVRWGGEHGIRMRPLSPQWIRPFLGAEDTVVPPDVNEVAAAVDIPPDTTAPVVVGTPVVDAPVVDAPPAPVDIPPVVTAPAAPVVTPPVVDAPPAPVVTPPAAPVVSAPPAPVVTALPLSAMRPLPPSVRAPKRVGLPLFHVPTRVDVFAGFEFDSLVIDVDGVPLPNARQRVGRWRDTLAAAVPEARAGSLVWVEGDLANPFSDGTLTGTAEDAPHPWPTLAAVPSTGESQ